MRAIDHYDDSQMETLRLKGMLPVKTATEKPKLAGYINDQMERCECGHLDYPQEIGSDDKCVNCTADRRAQ